MSVARAAAGYLALQGIVSWRGLPADAGLVPVFVGQLPSKPDAAVLIVQEPAGPEATGGSFDLAGLRVLVRHPGIDGDKTGPGESLTQQIIDELHGLGDTTWAADTSDETIVSSVWARDAVPNPLGPDASGHPEWLAVFTVDHYRTTPHRKETA